MSDSVKHKIDKFLCDQMCLKLGRWLRAAGYDVSVIDAPLEDQKIFQKAVEEHRRLLTKDKFFKEMDPDGKTVVYLKGSSLDEWAKQLKNEEGVDWLYRPFSRCLKCNCILEKTALSPDVPDQVRKRTTEFLFCSNCNQTFWLGSHTDRMTENLRGWQLGPSG
jgi:uncharacterized protein